MKEKRKGKKGPRKREQQISSILHTQHGGKFTNEEGSVQDKTRGKEKARRGLTLYDINQ